MFTGWVQYFRNKFGGKREFVSLDAAKYSQARSYELLEVGSPTLVKSVGSTAITSPTEAYASPLGRTTPDYFSKRIQRDYRSPTLSFSGPRTPSQSGPRIEWDPRTTHARGGLGLHPPATEPATEDDGGLSERNMTRTFFHG